MKDNRKALILITTVMAVVTGLLILAFSDHRRFQRNATTAFKRMQSHQTAQFILQPLFSQTGKTDHKKDTRLEKPEQKIVQ